MKKRVVFCITMMLVAFGWVTVGPAFAAHQTESGKLQVVTTLFPLYDWAKMIGGDRAQVTLLLPPGVESHSFEPTPRDIAAIHKGDLFIYTGKHMEPWVEGVLKGVKSGKLLIVDASQGIDLREEGAQEPERPFACAGAYRFEKGACRLVLKKGAEPAMKVILVPMPEATQHSLEHLGEEVAELFHGEGRPVSQGEVLTPEKAVRRLELKGGDASFELQIPETGAYAFFAEHDLEEFKAEVRKGGKTVKPAATLKEEEHRHGHNQHGNHGEKVGAHDHDHGGKDPHIWLEFGNAGQMVDRIARAFAQKDPENAQSYLGRARDYGARLRELDAAYEKTLAGCTHKTLMYGGHFAFGYLAGRYGLTHISPYKGFAPNAEPSPAKIAELIGTMKRSGLKVIFYEEGIDPRVARVISQETGARLLLLHGAHNITKSELARGVTYLSIMQDNLGRLKEGLDCR